MRGGFPSAGCSKRPPLYAENGVSYFFRTLPDGPPDPPLEPPLDPPRLAEPEEVLAAEPREAELEPDEMRDPEDERLELGRAEELRPE